MSMADELKGLAELKEAGALTEEEFQEQKAKLLAGGGGSAPAASQAAAPVQAEGYEWLTVLLLCWFLGILGVHRFYTGHTGMGVLYLLTAGLCGILVLVDFFKIITGNYTDSLGRPLVKK
jgi:hypothetical protein